jgi:hypothetical protein
VQSRRDGTSVFYRVDDEQVFDLLDAAARFHAADRREQSILEDLETP